MMATERDMEVEEYNWVNVMTEKNKEDFYNQQKEWLDGGGISNWPLDYLIAERAKQDKYRVLDDVWWNKTKNMYKDILDKLIKYKKSQPEEIHITWPTKDTDPPAPPQPDPILPVTPPSGKKEDLVDPEPNPPTPQPPSPQSHLPVGLIVALGLVGVVFLFYYFEK